MKYENHTAEYHNGTISVYHMDCMELLRQTPDKYYELACVDPPYGIGASNYVRGGTRYGNSAALCKIYTAKEWDNNIPEKLYFIELQRVSKNQIVWGGNYFANLLTNSSCWIVWDKNNGNNGYADCELAWTSFQTAVRKIKYTWHGMLQEDMKNKEFRIHSAQKPAALYEWLLQKYAKKGDKILDTHGGSMSIAIACHNQGYELTACELDKDYYDTAVNRIRQHQSQKRLKFSGELEGEKSCR